MARLTDLVRRLLRIFPDTRGAVSPLMTLLVVPIVGALALAGETGGWYYTQRAAQEAADSAALAAAANGCHTNTCGTQYSYDAAGAAAKYGFVNNTDNATVTPAYLSACPAPNAGSACYQVTISKVVPIRLARIVGFGGDADDGNGQTVTATAYARERVFAGYCVIALGETNNAFRINGGPKYNLGGCDVFSNGTANCNGGGGNNGDHFGILTGGAHGTSDCGAVASGGQPLIADPYSYLSTNANIPAANNCIPAGTAPTTINLALNSCALGTITIPTNQTTTITGGGTFRIFGGGGINLVDTTSKLLASAGTTIIFTGSAGNNAPGFVTGDGVIDFSAPNSGTWSGVALYQDHRMTKNSNVTYSGNKPTFNITGLIYAPYANVTFRGDINHSSTGYNCLGMVSLTSNVSGNGSIFANATSECKQAGLTLPTGDTTLVRQALVQ